MSELNRADRLQIMLTPEEIRALDDWRFAHRMPSRAAAIRELLKRGLAVDARDLETAGKHSARFGILEEPAAKRGGMNEGGMNQKARSSRTGAAD